MIHQDTQDFPWGRYPAYAKTAGWLRYGQRVICITESGSTEPMIFRGANGSGSLHHFDGATLSYSVIRDYLPADAGEEHNCYENAVPYESEGALGHGFECGRCGAFLQAG